MSFILDALKKSELERQRQAIPGLVESIATRPRSRLPLWAMALGGLLAVNLLVLMVVLLRGWLSATPPRSAAVLAAVPAAAPAAHADAAQRERAATDHFSPLDAPPVYAPEIPVTGRPPQPATQPAESVDNAAPRASHHRDPVLTNDDYKPADEEVLPSINELNLTGAQALPELHLDVHVFATKASDRFVYINMRKYHEGAALQEGPTLERIRRDGVVLDYQGLRFLLPRQ